MLEKLPTAGMTVGRFGNELPSTVVSPFTSMEKTFASQPDNAGSATARTRAMGERRDMIRAERKWLDGTARHPGCEFPMVRRRVASVRPVRGAPPPHRSL